AVDQERRRAGHFRPDAPDDGMRVATQELHVAASQAPEFVGDPFRGAPAIGVVEGQGRNGWDAEELGQLAEQSRLIHRWRQSSNGMARLATLRGGRIFRPMRTTASYDLFPDAPSERAMAKARWLAREGRVTDAESAYRDVLASHPDLKPCWAEYFELLRRH